MKKKDALGQFEQLVLTAVANCGEGAYSLLIQEHVEQLAQREVNLASVYVTLDRLEEKGYLTSWLGDPTPERGGKSKRYFKLLATGDRVMGQAVETSQRIVETWNKLHPKKR